MTDETASTAELDDDHDDVLPAELVLMGEDHDPPPDRIDLPDVRIKP